MISSIGCQKLRKGVHIPSNIGYVYLCPAVQNVQCNLVLDGCYHLKDGLAKIMVTDKTLDYSNLAII